MRLSALSPRIAGCAPGEVMMPTGCTSSWSRRRRNARLKSDGKPANATRGPGPAVMVSGGGGRSRSGMKVKISRAQRSLRTASRYAELVAISVDATCRGDRAHQSLANQCLEDRRDLSATTPRDGSPDALVQLVDA